VTVLDPDFMDQDNMTGRAPNGSCEFTAGHGHQGDYVEMITITIGAVANPGQVRMQYAADRNAALDEKTEYDVVKDIDIEGTGATACYRFGSQSYSLFHCHHKWLAFTVGAIGLGEVPGVPETRWAKR
jgi:hypothetical protein